MVELETIFVCSFPVELIANTIFVFFVFFKSNTRLAIVTRVVTASILVIINLIQVPLGIQTGDPTWTVVLNICTTIAWLSVVLLTMYYWKHK